MALSTEDLYALSTIRNLGPKTLREINRYAKDLDDPSSKNLALCLSRCKTFNSIKRANKIFQAEDLESLIDITRTSAYAYLENVKARGVSILSYNDPLYPKNLKQALTVDIEAKQNNGDDIFPYVLKKASITPPYLLYYRGNIELLKEDSVIITGSSECTSTARKASFYLGGQFAKQGLTIISDLSPGCNSRFLSSLLDQGINNIIAIESLGIINSEHPTLAERIVKEGGLILALEFANSNSLKEYHLRDRAQLEASLSLGSIIIQTTPNAFPMFAAINCQAALKPTYVVQYSDDDTELSPLNTGNHFLVDNFKCKILKAARDPKIMQEIIENIVQDLKRSKEHNLFSYLPELEDDELISQLEDLSAIDLVLYLLKKKGLPLINFTS